MIGQINILFTLNVFQGLLGSSENLPWPCQICN
jgi:hypothetical protein